MATPAPSLASPPRPPFHETLSVPNSNDLYIFLNHETVADHAAKHPFQFLHALLHLRRRSTAHDPLSANDGRILDKPLHCAPNLLDTKSHHMPDIYSKSLPAHPSFLQSKFSVKDA